MTTALPLVSIVTPSFNQGEFLEDTLQSVVGQDYPRIEYIVMDGGSTDGSVDIIRRYADRIVHWESGPDGGQSSAINHGWRRAHGEILYYLNSDDLLMPGAVSRVVKYFAEHSEVGIVYGSYNYLDGQGRLMFVRTPPEFSLERLLLEDFISQTTAFVRRDVLERIGLLDPQLHYVMDYDLWIRAALSGVKFGRIPGGPLAGYRHWMGTKSAQRGNPGLEEELQIKVRAFASDRLPARCRRLRGLALALSVLRSAYESARYGDTHQARKLLWRAVRTHWPVVARKDFLRVACGALVGRDETQPLEGAGGVTP